MEWTDAAREELDDACRRLRADIAARGDASDLDPDDVVEDMRLHVHEELAASGVRDVTRDDVRRVCARLDWGDGGDGDSTSSETKPDPGAEPQGTLGKRMPPEAGLRSAAPGGCMMSAIVFFGLIVPLSTLFIELASGFCASIFADPIPTVWHALLVGAVPIILTVVAGVSPETRRTIHRPLAYALGAAGGISFYYAVVFLPMAPVGVFGVLFLGLGLLPLSPFFTLVISVYLMVLLGREESAPDRRLPLRLAGGALVGCLALVVARLDLTVTNVGLQMAASDSVATRERGLDWLRRHGDEEEILRSCYRARSPGGGEFGFAPQGWGGVTHLMLGGAYPIEHQQAREIYYRVTGRPFNAMPHPDDRDWRTRSNPGVDWAAAWDEGLASDRVAAKVEGLHLVDSLVDMKVEPAAAIAYCEWTMEFENESTFQREARFHLALPTGGVVSRVTLWIDGEEREAAFGSREKTKAAYKSVVQRRRDPLLVTTAGVDRVLAQCFPVPPRGGRMKIRLGVTFPLPFVDASTLTVPHPVLEETNFLLAPEVDHSVWIESPFPLRADHERLEGKSTSIAHHVVRGAVSDARLADRTPLLTGSRPADATFAWVPLLDEEDHVAIQTIDAETVAPPSRIVVVVDGSAPLAEHATTIATALMGLPATVDLSLLIAGDEVVEELSGEAGRAELRLRIADAVRDFEYLGGRDAVPALRRALDLAEEGDRVLWLHGPQPVILAPLGPLDQALVRGRPRIPILEVPVVSGPNVATAVLHHRGTAEYLPRHGDLGADLERCFADWSGAGTRVVTTRTRGEFADVDPALRDAAASRHLARMWAHEEIGRLTARYSNGTAHQALELAERYQLVTPLSGAVVLETAVQYEAAGLEPVDPAEVPAVPEPEMVALVSIVVLFLLFAILQRRRGVWAA